MWTRRCSSVIAWWSCSTYLSLIYLATSMIRVPYLWSAAYALLLAVRGETYENALRERKKDLFIGAIALIYAVWLLYAGGTKYLLLSALLYAPGAILFAKAKRELGKPIFTNVEKLIFAAVVIGALVAAYGLYDGFLTLCKASATPRAVAAPRVCCSMTVLCMSIP